MTSSPNYDSSVFICKLVLRNDKNQATTVFNESRQDFNQLQSLAKKLEKDLYTLTFTNLAWIARWTQLKCTPCWLCFTLTLRLLLFKKTAKTLGMIINTSQQVYPKKFKCVWRNGLDDISSLNVILKQFCVHRESRPSTFLSCSL